MNSNHSGITGRGRSWEVLHSWWIALSFVCFAWVGFFYIGAKAKQKRWVYFGVLFFVLQFLGFIAVGATKGNLQQVFIYIWIASYGAGIVLAFTERKRYLISLDLLLNTDAPQKENQKLRDEVISDYRSEGIQVKDEETQDAVKPQADADIQKAASKVIDINACSELDFINLTGFNAATAKTAADYRKRHGGFYSVDEFLAITQVKPHLIEDVKSHIICGQYTPDSGASEKPAKPADQPSGRKLDF
ncbi:MAG: helix-hairpin-helix domain-containing protein [Pseudoramibacter sp.]